MPGKVLIVDTVATNRIALKTKLMSASYEVWQASTVAQAVDISRRSGPDLVITAHHLDGQDATALCTMLAGSPRTSRIPVFALAEGGGAALCLHLLANGAQEAMVKPVCDKLFLGRVRSMIRAGHGASHTAMRDAMCPPLGLEETAATFTRPGTFQIVSHDKAETQVHVTQLRKRLRGAVSQTTIRDALTGIRQNALPDVFILTLTGVETRDEAQLRLISTLRANTTTRHCGILVLQSRPHPAGAAHALDLGADDLMQHGFDVDELSLRLTGLLARKQQGDTIRRDVDTRLREAVFDPLTGIYNRRHALSEVARLAVRTRRKGIPLAVMLADIDHFKRVNDAFGHASGDAVLVETARRLKSCLRPLDVAARIGGEEFLLILPGITEAEATRMAKRICEAYRTTPFTIPASAQPIHATISIGLCTAQPETSDAFPAPLDASAIAAELIDRADQALYSAKHRGRNRVGLIRSAA
ncbi:diguanylate cyclase [uncultured Sulfitobacter sp.]|uniref:diguanylate cyclase domain-containing protein n=1 Tax=uncultured Sulfitobacter sp. TaxID=191468 RepID=UPI00259998A9|nr:diguanylate cyclase [uncultured Sulfitobacter sp.]